MPYLQRILLPGLVLDLEATEDLIVMSRQSGPLACGPQAPIALLHTKNRIFSERDVYVGGIYRAI